MSQGLVCIGDYSIPNIYSRLLDKIPLSGRVLIKPNVTGSYSPEEHRTTHPAVIAAIIEILQDQGCEVVIGESSSVGVSTKEAYETTGIGPVARSHNVPLIDFKGSSYHPVKVSDGQILSEIMLPDELLDYSLLNVAKLKTNHVSTISCALKNLKGLLRDEDKKEFHKKGLHSCVADLGSVVSCYNVIDGIVGSELYEPKRAGVIIYGSDSVIVDQFACWVMGVDPYSVGHLAIFGKKGRFSHLSNLPRDYTTPFKTTLPGTSLLEEEFGVSIVDGSSCSSCLGALYLTLRKARSAGVELPGKIALGPSLEGMIDDSYFLFGTCACSQNPSSQGVYGCPPTTGQVFEAIDK